MTGKAIEAEVCWRILRDIEAFHGELPERYAIARLLGCLARVVRDRCSGVRCPPRALLPEEHEDPSTGILQGRDGRRQGCA